MFQLDENEVNIMVSQNVIPSKSYFGGSVPFAFTEQGVVMLSSVLKSQKAIEINISVMRAFVQIRRFAQNYEELKKRIDEIEIQFPEIYKVLSYLIEKDNEETTQKERLKIGYKK